jgi:hypothetical protein
MNTGRLLALLTFLSLSDHTFAAGNPNIVFILLDNVSYCRIVLLPAFETIRGWIGSGYS